MRNPDTRTWMLTEAVELLFNADRLQRQFFRIGQAADFPRWEPPVDMFVNDREVGLLIALPGVPPDRFEVTLEQQAVLVSGERSFGANFPSGSILRMEIPYGRFERRIQLPYGTFQLGEVILENGCLRLTLERMK